MAFPGSTSRGITIDERQFDWVESLRFLSGRCQITLMIALRQGSHRKIRAHCSCAVNDSGHDRELFTTPGNVADVIRYAIAQGWSPDTAAADILIEEFDRLTELRQNPFFYGVSEDAV
ncbi:MAG: hypothetical protein VB858_02910 [Planctomycetaceae bacterium]|jgi:hypothetical protein